MQTRREILTTGLTFGAIGMASPALAGAWMILGLCKLDLTRAGQRIEVGARRGRFATLRLQVSGHEVNLQKVQVLFGDEDSVEIALDQAIEPGGQTRGLTLPGPARTIEAVDLTYVRAEAGGLAEVTLLGLRH